MNHGRLPAAGLKVEGLGFRGSGFRGLGFRVEVGYCPHPVTVYIRGPNKGCI